LWCWLIKIFQLETYCLSDDVEMIETLEHGSIIFWHEIWKKLGLDKIIQKQVNKRDKRITLINPDSSFFFLQNKKSFIMSC